VGDLAHIEIPETITAVYADPSRRINNRRSIEPSDYSPRLETIHERLSGLSRPAVKLIAKLSPLCDIDELLQRGTVEVVSYNGEVREILFRAGPDGGLVTAVVLNEDSADYILCSSAPARFKTTTLKKYIIEPDPAIIRADLVPQFAYSIGASLLARRLAYITSDTIPSGNVQGTFHVIETMPFSIKQIKQYLKDAGIKQLSVKKRGILETASQIQKDIGIHAGSNEVYLFVYRRGKQYEACLAKRC
jgi:hypothetical protein